MEVITVLLQLFCKVIVCNLVTTVAKLPELLLNQNDLPL